MPPVPTSVSAAVVLTQCWHRVPGGTASAAIGLVRAMARRDDVDLTGIGPGGRRGPDPAFAPPIPVRRLRLPHQLLYDAWHTFGIEAPERICGPVDVVHATATVVPPTADARLVVTVNDLFPISEPDVLTRRGARILTRGIEIARDRAAVVCCPSRQTLDDCAAFGFDPSRLHLVPYGADTVVADDATRRAALARHGLERPYLLWVGTVEPRKNLGLLLDAFRLADLDDVDLVIGGPAGWKEDLTPRLEGLGDRVHRIGFVPAADLAPLYASANALVFPSRREGFGMPALEAMAQGTPVVGAAGTAIAEVVGETGALVDPDDLRGWADALRTAADPGWKAGLTAAASTRAAAFTWDRAAEAQVAAYRAAVG